MPKYIYEKLIGKGSHSKVYIATNDSTKKKVVIKIITNNDKNRIYRDVDIPWMIDHPNVVKIIDFIEEKFYSYIIYPYLENSIPLSNIILNFEDKSHLSHMLNLLYQIANAIEYIHSKSIIHRDIKPENIIVVGSHAFLIDFNLSAIVGDPKYPVEKGIIGSPLYIAPEIFRDDENINYTLTDIYSFGITLYYIFNKMYYPYDIGDIYELQYSLLHSNPMPSLSGYKILDKLINSLINKNPTKRPNIGKIKEILDALYTSFSTI